MSHCSYKLPLYLIFNYIFLVRRKNFVSSNCETTSLRLKLDLRNWMVSAIFIVNIKVTEKDHVSALLPKLMPK